MADDLELTSSQYSIVLVVFFGNYTLCSGWDQSADINSWLRRL